MRKNVYMKSVFNVLFFSMILEDETFIRKQTKAAKTNFRYKLLPRLYPRIYLIYIFKTYFTLCLIFALYQIIHTLKIMYKSSVSIKT